jgi:hypothetical protein
VVSGTRTAHAAHRDHSTLPQRGRSDTQSRVICTASSSTWESFTARTCTHQLIHETRRAVGPDGGC